MSGEIGVRTSVVEEAERKFDVTIGVTQHDSAIFAGFQQLWGEAEVDGDKMELSVGAGVGSQYGVVRYRGKSYVFSGNDLAKAIVDGAEAAS